MPLSADAVAKSHTTSKGRDAPLVATPKLLSADVLFVVNKGKIDNWGKKAIRRRTTGTGRMRSLKDIPRKLKNGFKEFSQAKRVKQRGKGKSKPEVKETK